jgi:hypothetical protein
MSGLAAYPDDQQPDVQLPGGPVPHQHPCASYTVAMRYTLMCPPLNIPSGRLSSTSTVSPIFTNASGWTPCTTAAATSSPLRVDSVTPIKRCAADGAVAQNSDTPQTKTRSDARNQGAGVRAYLNAGASPLPLATMLHVYRHEQFQDERRRSKGLP